MIGPRTLYLLRHAKAEERLVPMLDFNRRLHADGVIEANTQARIIQNKGITIDFLITSAAPRAHQTAVLVASYLNFNGGRIESDESIYSASVQQLVKRVSEVPDFARDVMLVGHNPALTELVGYLSNHYITSIPTSGLVVLRYPGETWKDLSYGTCQFGWQEFPA